MAQSTDYTREHRERFIVNLMEQEFGRQINPRLPYHSPSDRARRISPPARKPVADSVETRSAQSAGEYYQIGHSIIQSPSNAK
jgi:hypothetical protein